MGVVDYQFVLEVTSQGSSLAFRCSHMKNRPNCLAVSYCVRILGNVVHTAPALLPPALTSLVLACALHPVWLESVLRTVQVFFVRECGTSCGRHCSFLNYQNPSLRSGHLFHDSTHFRRVPSQPSSEAHLLHDFGPVYPLVPRFTVCGPQQAPARQLLDLCKDSVHL